MKLKNTLILLSILVGSIFSNAQTTKIDLTTQVQKVLPASNGGTGVTSTTGSGSVVLNTSPTLVTPNLGTPTSVNLINGIGLPLDTGTTGILPHSQLPSLLKTDIPNIDQSQVNNLSTDLSAKAPLDSPALINTPTAPTPTTNTNNTQIATTQFVQTAKLFNPYVEITSTYSILSTDHQINCTANSFTVTLPTAVGIQGRIYSIKNTGSGIITVNTTSSQKIDGQLSQQITNGSNIQVMSTGANWIIL